MPNKRQWWIVDDDPVFRMIFCMVLTKTDDGIDCKECIDGNDFLEKLQVALAKKEALPQVVFLDLNMPGKSGWEVLDALNAFEAFPSAESKIFVLSSSINPEDEQNAKAHPYCNGFLVKPISKRVLNRILSKPLGN